MGSGLKGGDWPGIWDPDHKFSWGIRDQPEHSNALRFLHRGNKKKKEKKEKKSEPKFYFEDLVNKSHLLLKPLKSYNLLVHILPCCGSSLGKHKLRNGSARLIMHCEPFIILHREYCWIVPWVKSPRWRMSKQFSCHDYCMSDQRKGIKYSSS